MAETSRVIGAKLSQAGSEQQILSTAGCTIFVFSDFFFPLGVNIRVQSFCPGYFRFECQLRAQCWSRRGWPFPQNPLNTRSGYLDDHTLSRIDDLSKKKKIIWLDGFNFCFIGSVLFIVFNLPGQDTFLVKINYQPKIKTRTSQVKGLHQCCDGFDSYRRTFILKS